MRLILLIIIFSFALLPYTAFAVNATESITLVLPEDGSRYTLNNGGIFNTLTVNSSNFVFEIADRKSVV